ncbi:MAG: zinc-ribbon and DUF3426 domain-containing protein [Pseudomonadota bacterium]|nr:zinc-ribbon and DUF3426 domain-containing protein [Pseudomonadota bacterium]
MAFHITQCPCCNSTFSISDRLLNAANGKVRCGVCLSVFIAEQQLVDGKRAAEVNESNDSVFVGHAPEDYFDPASFLTREALQQQPMNNRVANSEPGLAKKTEAELCSSSALPQSSASPESVDDHGSAEDIAAEPGSGEGRAEAIKTSVTPAVQTNNRRSQCDSPDKLPPGRKNALEALRLANEFRPDQQPSQNHMKNVQHAIARRDAALNALDLFRSTAQDTIDSTGPPGKPDEVARYPEAHRRKKDQLPDTVPEQAGSRKATDRSAPLASQPAVQNGPQNNAHTPAPAKTGGADIAGSLEKLAPGEGPPQASLTPEKLQRVDTAATSFSTAVTEQNADAQNSSGAIRARALKMKFKDDQALEQLATENLASLQRVATPVELRSESPAHWGRTLTLLLTAGILGMSLAGQHLLRNQENYSQQVRWRPLLEWICANRGCDLPLYEDLSAIEPSNLSVGSHPNRADTIMVQVQIRNTAPFEQAFPVMIVGFNTTDNELIALREFSPTEYLQGELPESATMPVMAPIPINLALMDPGEDAVNYTLAFRRP